MPGLNGSPVFGPLSGRMTLRLAGACAASPCSATVAAQSRNAPRAVHAILMRRLSSAKPATRRPALRYILQRCGIGKEKRMARAIDVSRRAFLTGLAGLAAARAMAADP